MKIRIGNVLESLARIIHFVLENTKFIPHGDKKQRADTDHDEGTPAQEKRARLGATVDYRNT